MKRSLKAEISDAGPQISSFINKVSSRAGHAGPFAHDRDELMSQSSERLAWLAGQQAS